jgi:pseudo-rSAM protein
MIDIQIKQELNLNYYGRLSIKSNGDIYSNLNKSKVGNYFETSISECISFELDNKHGWKHTRKYIKPCNQCIYQYLCPSLSNYEYVMRKPNLCQVL